MPVPRRITGGMPCHRSHARLGDVPEAESNGGGGLMPGAAGSRRRAGNLRGRGFLPDFRPGRVRFRRGKAICLVERSPWRPGRAGHKGRVEGGRTRIFATIEGRKAGKSPAARNIRSCPSYIELKKGADDGRNQSQADTRPGTAGVVRSLPPVAIRPIPGIPRRARGPQAAARTGQQILKARATIVRTRARDPTIRVSRHRIDTPALSPSRPGRVPRPPISTYPTTPLAIASHVRVSRVALSFVNGLSAPIHPSGRKTVRLGKSRRLIHGKSE